MTWVVPLALGGFAILLMAVFTMVSARKRHAGVIAPATTVGPRILVHDINDDRCTGCDACVAVCPTNVLDLVANKSRVLRFEDCIQCEACMFACPTEALVMFPEGAVPPPLKVPEIDENFQTVVPGQYLIGEVAGKPLVKSAANLGRAVVEHMLHTGLRGGALGHSDTVFDVAIVGSGPGGLSAALTCIQRGLSYVVLEKEQMIASTIARYPKGKLVMAEPYDTTNLSYLPVFDSAKEQLIPIWQELIQRVGVAIRQGESVESVSRAADGAFELRSTVNSYRAQRVVLSIGTRGKPRTLQVPGENLPKIFNLLDDPDEWRGRSVLVVGGGDSACEAALALADAGAKVMISYRGKGFNRAAPKNKQTIEAYAAEGRIKAKLGSQVLAFEPDSVTLALADGNQKRYPNDGAFVLIGADPPVAWLEKMGIQFVERPHQYQMGKTDDIVRRYAARATECPEDAARAAAAILGGSVGYAPAPELPMPMGSAGPGQVSGPRKWLRSATSIFSNRAGTNGGQMAPPPPPSGAMRAAPKVKKFDAPVPLSEFAKRGKTQGPTAASGGTGVHHAHTGHGRRDQLSAGERTRILRMLRDEGGRLADEDSQVYIGAAPGGRDDDYDFADPAAAAPGRGPSAA
ncbi:MAG: NAD(P)-binding domain-containing protein, partial [Myxococcota bacterium]|nr:NAD(P)-binding domain-containing protein [Myxococcota bacterium]